MAALLWHRSAFLFEFRGHVLQGLVEGMTIFAKVYATVACRTESDNVRGGVGTRITASVSMMRLQVWLARALAYEELLLKASFFRFAGPVCTSKNVFVNLARSFVDIAGAGSRFITYANRSSISALPQFIEIDALGRCSDRLVSRGIIQGLKFEDVNSTQLRWVRFVRFSTRLYPGKHELASEALQLPNGLKNQEATSFSEVVTHRLVVRGPCLMPFAALSIKLKASIIPPLILVGLFTLRLIDQEHCGLSFGRNNPALFIAAKTLHKLGERDSLSLRITPQHSVSPIFRRGQLFVKRRKHPVNLGVCR